MKSIYFFEEQKGVVMKFSSLFVIVLFVLFLVSKASAQLADSPMIITKEAKVIVNPGATLSVHNDYINKGLFQNDGEVYFYNNWINEGKIGFSKSENGITYFKGEKEQILEGDGSNFFHHIVFESGSSDPIPFHLKTTFEIEGTARFKNGIIDGANYKGKLFFTESAEDPENVSDKSFMDGQVIKSGASIFDFPVGSSHYYRPIKNNSGQAQDLYSVQYFYKNSDSSYPHAKKDKNIQLIDNAEYWIIDKEDSDKDNMVLTLTINSKTTPPDFYEKEIPGIQTGIVRWDEGSARWVSEGGKLDSSKKFVMTHLTGYGVVTFGHITEASDKDDDGDLVIYNAITANNSGTNDYLLIKGIDHYPNNTLEIFNRDGNLVYKTEGYNEENAVFRGIRTESSGLAHDLDTGTYYYILRYIKEGKTKTKSGYLYINK